MPLHPHHQLAAVNRYWTAATEGMDDTWIAHYAPLINRYGTADGVLTRDLIQQRVPKARLYLCSIYWALTTVRGGGVCVFGEACMHVWVGEYERLGRGKKEGEEGLSGKGTGGWWLLTPCGAQNLSLHFLLTMTLKGFHPHSRSQCLLMH